MNFANSSLKNLMILKNVKSRRISSYDQSGGNRDWRTIKSGKTLTIADIEGPGVITHIWMTFRSSEKHFLCKGVLRMFWDNENDPSVEVPIGDFFGAGHGKTENFSSLPFQMSPEDGRGFNCFFPMPFKKGARIEIENENYSQELVAYYYIDYELWPEFPDNIGYFHANWNREIAVSKNENELVKELAPRHLKDIALETGVGNNIFEFYGSNKTGKENYIILDAEGKGHYVGCFFYVHNMRETDQWDWYGEGDDMIFVDGEEWPPSLHGTGTEDYFSMAWCPSQKYSSNYFGLILPGKENWKGYMSMYRFHIEDPVHFSKSIKVTVEKGHNNNRFDDYSSVAFWYQSEPHKKFEKLLSVYERLPIAD
ncbi:MAG: glycoside hydrolase family 172 protein [Petrotogales bacterium]